MSRGRLARLLLHRRADPGRRHRFRAQDVYERLTSVRTIEPRVRDRPRNRERPVDATFEWQSVDSAHAFFSTAESLDPATDTDSSSDIYDRAGWRDHACREGAADGNGAFTSSFGRSSEDGTLVFFTTRETLTTNDGDRTYDIYRRDLSNIHHFQDDSGGSGAFDASPRRGSRVRGHPEFPRVRPPFPRRPGAALQFDVSADGSHVFYETSEPGINDFNNRVDVYERPSHFRRCRPAG